MGDRAHWLILTDHSTNPMKKSSFFVEWTSFDDLKEKIMQTLRIHTFRKAAIVMGIMASSLVGRPAFAVDVLDDPAQIDERLTQVVNSSNSLAWEMYRYHQRQPNYDVAYRNAKDLWSKAAQLQDSLRNGPLETAVLVQEANGLNQISTQLQSLVAGWGDGDRSSLTGPTTTVQRTVVAPGVGVNLPLIGVQVGTPGVVVTDEVVPQLQRHRLHPNSRGSKRSLERELAAARVALNYLMEDAGITPPATADAKGPAPEVKGPTPDPALSDTAAKPAQSPTPIDKK
jgi:hypothetical protein